MQHIDTLAVYCFDICAISNQVANHIDIAMERRKMKCCKSVVTATMQVQPLLQLILIRLIHFLLVLDCVISISAAASPIPLLCCFSFSEDEVNENLDGAFVIFVCCVHYWRVAAFIEYCNQIYLISRSYQMILKLRVLLLLNILVDKFFISFFFE